MNRKSTLEDIAKRANVSKSTVSKAFSSATDIGEDTRKDILKAAEELGYKPKHRNSLKRVGFLIQNTDYQNENDFAFQILMSFKSLCAENGYEVVIQSFDSNKSTEKTYESILEENEFIGAFIIGLDLEHTYFNQIATTGFPTVMFDNYIDNELVTGVSVDSILGISLAVEHLVKCGHKRIGLLNGNPCSMVSHERLNGYIVGLSQNRLAYDKSLTLFTDYCFQSGINAAEYFKEKQVTAVICASDIIAIGLIKKLKVIGIKVPADISVTGYDNIPLSQYMNPELTTIEQDRIRIGEAAFWALDDLIKGKKGVKIILPPKLIIRESTRKI